MRIRHKRREKLRRQERSAAIELTRNLVEKSGDVGLANTRRVYNVTLFALVLDNDLAMLTSDMVAAVGEERRVFVARSLAILLYEAAQDLPDLLGREYRDTLMALRVAEPLFDELTSVSKEFNRFKQERREFLKKIRNLVGAHRDKNAISQLQLLDALDPLEVMRLAAEFSGPLEALAQVQIELMRHIGGFDVMALDLLSKNKSNANDNNPRKRGRRS